MDLIINNWDAIVALYVAIIALLRAFADVTIALGMALNNPNLGVIGAKIGMALVFIGKFAGLFGFGTPSRVKKELAAEAAQK